MFKYIVNKLKKVTTNHVFNRNNVNIIVMAKCWIFSRSIIKVCVCFQIYPDPESEKAIMGSVVYCIHHKEGCKWSDELKLLKVSLC